jgi:ATP-dependent helicase/DNAse subunit B
MKKKNAKKLKIWRALTGKETKYEMARGVAVASIQPGRKFDDMQHLYGLLSG